MSKIVNEIRRLIISKMISDLVLKTKENIKKFQPKSSQDVRLLGKPLIEFSNSMSLSMKEIRAFLTTKMYKHFEINRMTSKAKRIVSDLFKIYSLEADCLPNEWKLNYDSAKNSFSRNRIITDYIAGMTDRFAINEHKKLFDFNKGW